MYNTITFVVLSLLILVGNVAGGPPSVCEELLEVDCNDWTRCNSTEPGWNSVSHCRWDSIGGSCRCKTAFVCEGLYTEASCGLATYCPNSPQNQCYWNPEGKRCECSNNGKTCSMFSQSTIESAVACPEQPSRSCVWDDNFKEGKCKISCGQLQHARQCLESSCPDDPSRRCIWKTAGASNICQCATGNESCSDHKQEKYCNSAYCPFVGFQYNKFRSKCSWDNHLNTCSCRPVHYTPTTCHGVPKELCNLEYTKQLPGLRDNCGEGCEVSQLTGQCSCIPSVEIPTSCDQIQRDQCIPDKTKNLKSISKWCSSGCRYDVNVGCRCVDEPHTHCRELPIEMCSFNNTQTPLYLSQCSQGCAMRNGQCRCMPQTCSDVSNPQMCLLAAQTIPVSLTCSESCFLKNGECDCKQYESCSDVPTSDCVGTVITNCRLGCTVENEACQCKDTIANTPCDAIPLSNCTIEKTHLNNFITGNGCALGCHISFGNCLCINQLSDLYDPLYDVLPATNGSRCAQISILNNHGSDSGVVTAYVNDLSFGLLIYKGVPGSITEYAIIGFDFGPFRAHTTDSENSLLYVMFESSIRSFDVTSTLPRYLGVIYKGLTRYPYPVIPDLILCGDFLFFFDAWANLQIIGINTVFQTSIPYGGILENNWFDVVKHNSKLQTFNVLVGSPGGTVFYEVFMGNIPSKKVLWNDDTASSGIVSDATAIPKLYLRHGNTIKMVSVLDVNNTVTSISKSFSDKISFLGRKKSLLSVSVIDELFIFNITTDSLLSNPLIKYSLNNPQHITIDDVSGAILVIQREVMFTVLMPNVSFIDSNIHQTDIPTDNGDNNNSLLPIESSVPGIISRSSESSFWSFAFIIILGSLFVVAAVVIAVFLYLKRLKSSRSDSRLVNSEMTIINNNEAAASL